MNIDELWTKYATWTEGIGEWIHKDNFTEAIAEVISSGSLPADLLVSQNFAEMTAKEQVAAIIEWQTNGIMHPLTCDCGNNTPFNEIVIDIKNNKVAINCNKCGIKQDWIPTPVFAYYLQSKISG